MVLPMPARAGTPPPPSRPAAAPAPVVSIASVAYRSSAVQHVWRVLERDSSVVHDLLSCKTRGTPPLPPPPAWANRLWAGTRPSRVLLADQASLCTQDIRCAWISEPRGFTFSRMRAAAELTDLAG